MERLNRRSRVTLQCAVCGGDFWTHAFRADTAKYCSKACWARRAAKFACETCGKTCQRDSRRARFCSQACYRKHAVGPGAARWKGGSSLETERGRASAELAKWRKAVFQRDSYTCQHCEAKGCELHAHHIQPFANFPDLRFDISNGQTLCVVCHGSVHGKDFSNRRRKSCRICGEPSSGRGTGMCRSCATKRLHERGRIGFRRRIDHPHQGELLAR